MQAFTSFVRSSAARGSRSLAGDYSRVNQDYRVLQTKIAIDVQSSRLQPGCGNQSSNLGQIPENIQYGIGFPKKYDFQADCDVTHPISKISF
jgi:hypothetical protein